MEAPYVIPAQTRIGHVHLKVADLERSLAFYCGLLGFELITRYGTEAAFISAGGYHHHIGLNNLAQQGRPTCSTPIGRAFPYRHRLSEPSRPGRGPGPVEQSWPSLDRCR